MSTKSESVKGPLAKFSFTWSRLKLSARDERGLPLIFIDQRQVLGRSHGSRRLKMLLKK